MQWEPPKDDAKSLVVHSKEDIPNAEEIERFSFPYGYGEAND